jgi:FKBP-type peptidyl-prolyl cis-trans isomerase
MYDEMKTSTKIVIALIISAILILLFALMIFSNQPATEEDTTVTLDSGVEYVVLQESDSDLVVEDGVFVDVYYTGRLTDGTEFDSNEGSGRPFTVLIGDQRVIPGFEEGMLGMKVGEKRTIFIPSELGYGERGQGEIPPNADLEFDIEVVDVFTN